MLTIKAEILPGSDIEEAFKDASELAKKLNCFVEFYFNGVKCCASPDGDAKLGAQRYRDSLQYDPSLRYANNFQYI